MYTNALYIQLRVDFISLAPASNSPSGRGEAGRLRHLCDVFPVSILRMLNHSISSVYHLEPKFALLRPRGVLQAPGLYLPVAKATLHALQMRPPCFLDPPC